MWELEQKEYFCITYRQLSLYENRSTYLHRISITNKSDTQYIRALLKITKKY